MSQEVDITISIPLPTEEEPLPLSRLLEIVSRLLVELRSEEILREPMPQVWFSREGARCYLHAKGVSKSGVIPFDWTHIFE